MYRFNRCTANQYTALIYTYMILSITWNMKSDNESSNIEIYWNIFQSYKVYFTYIVKQQAAKLYDPYDIIAYNESILTHDYSFADFIFRLFTFLKFYWCMILNASIQLFSEPCFYVCNCWVVYFDWEKTVMTNNKMVLLYCRHDIYKCQYI